MFLSAPLTAACVTLAFRLSNPALGFLVRNIPSDPANIYGNNINYNRVSVMVFNATFNNISVTSWQSVLMVEETRVPRENN
jgi:hypothetical protein